MLLSIKALTLTYFITFSVCIAAGPAITDYADAIQIKLLDLGMKVKDVKVIYDEKQKGTSKQATFEIINENGLKFRITHVVSSGGEPHSVESVSQFSVNKYLRQYYLALALPEGVTTGDVTKMLRQGIQEADAAYKELENFQRDLLSGEKRPGDFSKELRGREFEILKNAGKQLEAQLAKDPRLNGLASKSFFDFSDEALSRKDYVSSREKTANSMVDKITGIELGVNLALSTLESEGKGNHTEARALRKTLIEIVAAKTLAISMANSIKQIQQLTVTESLPGETRTREAELQTIQGRLKTLQLARILMNVMLDAYSAKSNPEVMARFEKNALKLFHALNLPMSEGMRLGTSSKVFNYAIELQKILTAIELAKENGITEHRRGELRHEAQKLQYQIVDAHTKCKMSHTDKSSPAGKVIGIQEIEVLGKQIIMAEEAVVRIRGLKAR